jgi:hypothetical protein
MKELLTEGAIDKNKLPLFFTTWVDKTSQHCMFSQGQLRMWTLPHLKAGSWYLDYGKGFCPEEEEELKNKLDAANIASGSDVGVLQEGTGNADELDLSQMNEKEKKKVIAQRIADAEKAKKRLDKEAAKATEKSEKDATKSSKKGEKRSGKSTAKEAGSDNEDTTHASGNPLKRDSTFAGLSSLKLQQGTITKLQNVGSSNMLVDELIVNCSLLSIDQYYAKHNTFPKCWDDIIAILEKVSRLATLQNYWAFPFLLSFLCSLWRKKKFTSHLIFKFCVPAQKRPPTNLL